MKIFGEQNVPRFSGRCFFNTYLCIDLLEKHHINHIFELVEPVFFLNEKLVDAGQGDVQLAQSLILLQEVVQVRVKVNLNKSFILTNHKDGLRIIFRDGNPNPNKFHESGFGLLILQLL